MLHILCTLPIFFCLLVGCNAPQDGSQFPIRTQQNLHSTTAHTIVLYIITDTGTPIQQFSVDIQRNGKNRNIPCYDRGGNDYDQPNDGIYVCISKGAYTKYININIKSFAKTRQEKILYTGLLRTDNLTQNTFGFQLTRGINQNMLLRTANTSQKTSYSMENQSWFFTILGWGILVFLYFGILWRHKRQ